MFLDIIFNFLVYNISLYLLLFNIISIKIVGYSIFISHLYKDLTNMKNWPYWTEFIGIILSIILVYNGINISNYFIFFIGISKILAHFRKIIFKGNRYYY